MRTAITDGLLAKHDALVGTDNAFQRRARLLQTLWREERGLPIGIHRGKPLGSRIDAAHARDTLGNFLTDGIRDVVRHAVLGPGRTPGQLIDEDRLFSNLLSSQPLCFNLFGELARNLDLATRVFRELAPQRVERVLSIAFEHSPGRGDMRFTADRSAFDVFVTYDSPAGKRGFLGIEIKYHEALGDPPAEHRARYDAVADAMGCFVAEREALKRPPLQQIWRDHLLAGALVPANVGYDEGAFVFRAPEGNVACHRAVGRYRKHLTSEETFLSWTLEDVVRPFERTSEPAWMAAFVDRYLAFERVDACVEREGDATPCSSCGHIGSLPIWSGEPTRALERMALTGEIALGGCVVWPEKPTRRCGVRGRVETRGARKRLTRSCTTRSAVDAPARPRDALSNPTPTR